MSVLRLFLILLILASGSELRAALPDDVASANQILSSGHPVEALASYQSLLASPQFAKVSSPELWYHRGLAEEKNGDTLAASLSFRRSLLLDPTFVAARSHLNALLGTLGLSLTKDWHDQILMTLHPDILILGGATLGWLGILILVFLLFTKPCRPLFIALSIVAIIFGHGLSLFGTLSDPRRMAPSQAIVTAKRNSILRETPFDSAKAEGRLAPGTLITILSRNGVWWKVSDGINTGWISSNDLTPLLPSSVGL